MSLIHQVSIQECHSVNADDGCNPIEGKLCTIKKRPAWKRSFDSAVDARTRAEMMSLSAKRTREGVSWRQ